MYPAQIRTLLGGLGGLTVPDVRHEADLANLATPTGTCER